MNAKNDSYIDTPPGKVSPHPGDPLLWSKVDPDEYAGGLVRAGYPGDAGFDLCASRQVTVPPNSFARIPTNVRVALPIGRWAMLVGRSSTFFKRQLLVQTAIIDNGWRGELWFVVFNLAATSTTIRKKERLSQLIVFDLIIPDAQEVESNMLPPGDRGEAGFGSTDPKEGEL